MPTRADDQRRSSVAGGVSDAVQDSQNDAQEYVPQSELVLGLSRTSAELHDPCGAERAFGGPPALNGSPNSSWNWCCPAPGHLILILAHELLNVASPLISLAIALKKVGDGIVHGLSLTGVQARPPWQPPTQPGVELLHDNVMCR